ncbi:MAG: WYL domain-containing protein, partial [Deltaproteobacteria bacterium]|nr:WYL domain-containing protein [Deltaproteobacteria bacterium]
FNEFRSRWVREQLWHPAQQLSETEDGGIEITFPVADFREVKMMILQFGADVRVVSPAELREEIAAEAERMRGMYGC